MLNWNSASPHVYDEADYMYAASLGYFPNWTDKPTLSLPEFLRILIPVSRLGLNEHGVRSVMPVIPGLALLAVYLGCLWLLPGLSGSLAAFLGAAHSGRPRRLCAGRNLVPVRAVAYSAASKSAWIFNSRTRQHS